VVTAAGRESTSVAFFVGRARIERHARGPNKWCNGPAHTHQRPAHRVWIGHGRVGKGAATRSPGMITGRSARARSEPGDPPTMLYKPWKYDPERSGGWQRVHIRGLTAGQVPSHVASVGHISSCPPPPTRFLHATCLTVVVITAHTPAMQRVVAAPAAASPAAARVRPLRLRREAPTGPTITAQQEVQ